jgi:hypothetical protein
MSGVVLSSRWGAMSADNLHGRSERGSRRGFRSARPGALKSAMSTQFASLWKKGNKKGTSHVAREKEEEEKEKRQRAMRTVGQPHFRAVLCKCEVLVWHFGSRQSVIVPVKKRPLVRGVTLRPGFKQEETRRDERKRVLKVLKVQCECVTDFCEYTGGIGLTPQPL